LIGGYIIETQIQIYEIIYTLARFLFKKRSYIFISYHYFENKLQLVYWFLLEMIYTNCSTHLQD